MKQKVIKIGSSVGIVIPKPIAQEKGYMAGREYSLRTENNSNRIIIEPAITNSKTKGNPQLIAWAEDAVERYRTALEALKDR